VAFEKSGEDESPWGMKLRLTPRETTRLDLLLFVTIFGIGSDWKPLTTAGMKGRGNCRPFISSKLISGGHTESGQDRGDERLRINILD
jgi:hypothetical protein